MTKEVLLRSWGMNHMIPTAKLEADLPLYEQLGTDEENDDIDDEVREYLNDVDDPRWYEGVVRKDRE